MPQIDESQFSVDDLIVLGLISKDGRPSDNMTDKLWQHIFKQMKKYSIPFVNGEKKRMKYPYIRALKDEHGHILSDETTQYQRYCCFINDALRDIRIGKIAYCYYLHQIRVLLRFHPNLNARFNDYYWEVFLDEKEKQ